MTKKHVLVVLGCRLEDVYRASIEAASLAKHSILELWDVGWVEQKLHAKNYTRFRSAPAALPKIIFLLLPEVIFYTIAISPLKNSINVIDSMGCTLALRALRATAQTWVTRLSPFCFWQES